MSFRNKTLWLVILGISSSIVMTFSAAVLTAQTDKEAGKPDGESKPKKTTRQHLMDGKMVITQEIFRGVVLGDFERIEKQAVALNVLTLAEEWGFNNSKQYVRMSEDLRRISKQLASAAKKKDANAATLAYQRMTLNCVECHEALKDGFE